MVSMEWKSAARVVDCVLAPSVLLALLAYHAFLFHRVRTSPSQTHMGINRHARRLWVREMLTVGHCRCLSSRHWFEIETYEKDRVLLCACHPLALRSVKDNHKKNVLVVQTLRNSIMESSVLASTTVFLTVALATYFTFASRFKHLLLGIEGVDESLDSSLGEMSSTIKTLSVLTCFLISFLCHTQSICFYNHVNYITNIRLDWSIACEHIADILDRASILYTIGSRTFYMALPLLLWVFGSVPMLLLALSLLPILYKSDFPQSTKAQDSLQCPTDIQLRPSPSLMLCL